LLATIIALGMCQVSLVAIRAVAEPARGAQNATAADTRYWLENMACYHAFTDDEIASAMGIPVAEVPPSLAANHVARSTGTRNAVGRSITMVPYPGGRSPFPVDAQDSGWLRRDTKLSVFAPWDSASYAVLEVPRAVITDQGVVYPDCRSVPTVWTREGACLPRVEWVRLPNSTLTYERVLPIGVAFGAKATCAPGGVRMELWLRNGTESTLKYVMAQCGSFLARLKGFEKQSAATATIRAPYVAARSADGAKWAILAWDAADRTWCDTRLLGIRSDPTFPDCPPHGTVKVQGWFSFYQGTDIDGELKRIDTTGWRSTQGRSTARATAPAGGGKQQ
jgi:hypothetical protein